MKLLKNIFQRIYPYGIFAISSPLPSGGGRGEAAPAVYLTFDDGPIPEVTPAVLDILARYGVKAAFFMVGENIDKHPDVFEQVLQAGHSFGNHTYNHLKGWRCSFDEYMANVKKFPKQTRLFRPPYGKATLRQRRALHKMGYRLYYWDILTKDYDASRTPEAMLAQIKRETRPGSIINFHDSLKSNERMLTVLPQAIEWLQAQGYELKRLE